MSGWITLHRSLMQNDLWINEKFTRGQAWVDLLLLTNHAEGSIRVNGVKVALNRGDCGWSVVKLSARWGWSRTKAQAFLNELINDNQITQKKDRRLSVITICNYSLYQDICEEKKHQKNIRKTSEKHQKDTNNNDNKKNKSIYTENFLTFWKAYPSNVDKKRAAKTFAKVEKDNIDLNTLLDGIKIYIKNKPDWQEYKNASTWLNGSNWEDEYNNKKCSGGKWTTL